MSHILNGQNGRFPETTRQKVADAAAELGYVPSPAGRSLANGRSDVLVLLFPNTVIGSNIQITIERVVQATAAVGANVLTQFVGEDPRAAVASILRLRPMGVMDFSGTLTEAERSRFEAVHTVVVPKQSDPASNELFDLIDQIGELQISTLVAGGRRRLFFAYLGDDHVDTYAPARFGGISRASQRLGLGEPETLRVPMDLSGAKAALAAGVGDGSPLGVACFNDDVAIALVAAARELKLRVPEDVALIGLDNTAVGQLVHPRLTTIDVNDAAIADRAIVEFLAGLGDPHLPEKMSVGDILTVVQGDSA